jgi:hypothetical protein
VIRRFAQGSPSAAKARTIAHRQEVGSRAEAQKEAQKAE